jgi:hypothetical protein
MALRPGNEIVNRLYKYRPDNEHTLQLLKCQDLYFSFIQDFNDPFDCRVLVDCEGDENDWRSFAATLPISEEDNQRGIEYLTSIGFDAKTIKQQYDKQNFKTVVVYCLSEIRDNVLMWSHYANSHHGICIGFETAIQNNSVSIMTDDPDLNRHPDFAYHDFLPVSKVEYRNQYPQPYSIFKGETKDLIAFMTTKGKDWEYEKERRIIFAYKEIRQNIIKFKKPALKEVILGSSIRDSFKRQVLNLITKDYLANGYFVEVFESRLDDQRYKLNIEKIDIGNTI